MKVIAILALGALALTGSPVFAQEKESEKREKEREKRYEQTKKEQEKYRDEQEKRREKGGKEAYKNDDRYKGNDEKDVRRSGGKVGEILGKVILPPAGTAGPRQLGGVPKGHYPPPGSCRIWNPNKPAGHRPPPTSRDNLRGVALEPGAFILHGDRAYDTDYDWRKEEQKRPGSVGRDILDILFPNR